MSVHLVFPSQLWVVLLHKGPTDPWWSMVRRQGHTPQERPKIRGRMKPLGKKEAKREKWLPLDGGLVAGWTQEGGSKKKRKLQNKIRSKRLEHFLTYIRFA